MKSGLEGRNNEDENVVETIMKGKVSMKSGLEGRNNLPAALHQPPNSLSLNEVRPRRPEQCSTNDVKDWSGTIVSQ